MLWLKEVKKSSKRKYVIQPIVPNSIYITRHINAWVYMTWLYPYLSATQDTASICFTCFTVRSSRHCNVFQETNKEFQNSFIQVCQLLWTSLKPHPLQDACICSYRDISFIRVFCSAQHHCRTQGKMKQQCTVLLCNIRRTFHRQ